MTSLSSPLLVPDSPDSQHELLKKRKQEEKEEQKPPKKRFFKTRRNDSEEENSESEEELIHRRRGSIHSSDEDEDDAFIVNTDEEEEEDEDEVELIEISDLDEEEENEFLLEKIQETSAQEIQEAKTPIWDIKENTTAVFFSQSLNFIKYEDLKKITKEAGELLEEFKKKHHPDIIAKEVEAFNLKENAEIRIKRSAKDKNWIYVALLDEKKQIMKIGEIMCLNRILDTCWYQKPKLDLNIYKGSYRLEGTQLYLCDKCYKRDHDLSAPCYKNIISKSFIVNK